MIALIARSEYVRRVRSPWFIATTLLTPVLALGLFTLPLLMMSLGSDAGAARTLAIVDPSGALADSVAAGLPAPFTATPTALPRPTRCARPCSRATSAATSCSRRACSTGRRGRATTAAAAASSEISAVSATP